MYSRHLSVFLIVLPFLQLVTGDCVSYGWDFVDGGQGYFINNNDPAPFSFGTIFSGCVTEDTQGPITPIVVDPNENEYFCSDISDSPDGAVQMSSCNVAGGPPLYKNQMISGTYCVVVEGLTFAYMRTFTIIAGPQSTITATPTAIFSVTMTPSTTINTTSTSEYDTTLSPVTSIITLPSTTITKSMTTTPPKITVTTTLVSTKFKANTTVYPMSVITITKILTCPTQTPKKDPTCTLSLSKASLGASNGNATATSGSHKGKKMHRPRVPDRILPRQVYCGKTCRRAILAKRTADLPTIVVLETTYIASMYTTLTAPTSTEIDTYTTTSTSTITPPVVTSTSFSGKVKTVITVTAPTPTRTVVVHTTTTIFTTKTVWATITITSKIKPGNLVCSAGATPTPT